MADAYTVEVSFCRPTVADDLEGGADVSYPVLYKRTCKLHRHSWISQTELEGGAEGAGRQEQLRFFLVIKRPFPSPTPEVEWHVLINGEEWKITDVATYRTTMQINIELIRA